MTRTPCRALPPDGRFLAHLGPTPLVPVRLEPGGAAIWCKLEFLNPSGSTKDRTARYMLEKAWRQGTLNPGDAVAEASSGSTSIALALACAQMGLRFVAVMPEGVTEERVLTIRAYGGEVVLTPGPDGVRGAMAYVERLSREQGAFAPRQFENPDNAEAHRVWTGQEILAQIPGGAVDAVVSGVGTGGTIVGLHEAFREARVRYGRPLRRRVLQLQHPSSRSGGRPVEALRPGAHAGAPRARRPRRARHRDRPRAHPPGLSGGSELR